MFRIIVLWNESREYYSSRIHWSHLTTDQQAVWEKKRQAVRDWYLNGPLVEKADTSLQPYIFQNRNNKNY